MYHNILLTYNPQAWEILEFKMANQTENHLNVKMEILVVFLLKEHVNFITLTNNPNQVEELSSHLLIKTQTYRRYHSRVHNNNKTEIATSSNKDFASRSDANTNTCSKYMIFHSSKNIHYKTLEGLQAPAFVQLVGVKRWLSQMIINKQLYFHSQIFNRQILSR